ncbi:DUF1684 domain-containing protein [Aquimarina sp. ERC-38]|uniref:DUF1684 domain-containing protein n=1 Tax=Aquimarina sp. ERC-38 TaxID=2949996 RepID=UPI0022475A28|nr:DUF1684 domain-containing protein [Aquimarina sp. ERC-38]UZO80924.1 DUF1684 domain-containing protein [Aquimarina sp. ERC-38]
MVVSFIKLYGQQTDQLNHIVSFQDSLNHRFLTEETSPLPAEKIPGFKGLSFFKADTTYCVKALFVRTPYETPFIMKTTTDREPVYVKYGEAYFQLQGTEQKLAIYQSQQLKQEEEFTDHLFLPFTDVTNGVSSYEGGRFIDLKIPKKDSILIDFNRAYNPYCAYNNLYSCPIPPEENHLNIEIKAGVRKYDKRLTTQD